VSRRIDGGGADVATVGGSVVVSAGEFGRGGGATLTVRSAMRSAGARSWRSSPVRSSEQAAAAAEKWLREHCTEGSLQLVRVENLHAAVPEDQRQHLTLVRFVIGRVTASDVAGWLERAQKDDGADGPQGQEAA
jgi:hypothetical protein